MKPISDFYDKITGLHGQVATSDKEVDRLISLFESEMGQLANRFSTAEKKLKKKQGDSDVVELVKGFSGHIAGSLDAWEKKQADVAHNKRLRNVAHDSLLVIIYGKVKAGKSTLGNYVANKAPKGTLPSFFTFDRAGEKSTSRLEERPDTFFETKTTECTSTIQGFRIPGLTWIDTPGLASMTGENGALAKKYVEAADLIIYPMSSDSPGRHTDTNELRELAKAGEHFCVLITKSDFTEEDEEDGELVSILHNKSNEDRYKQEEWVRSEVCKKLGEVSADHGTRAEESLRGEILSMSIMAAREYPEGSEEWENSNIPKFYTMLNRILDEDAVRLRGEKALVKVSSYLRECVLSKSNPDSLLQRVDALNNELANLEKKASELKGRCNELVSACMPEVNLAVQQIVLDAKNSGGSGKEISNKIAGVVSRQVVAVAEPAAKDILCCFAEKLEAEFPSPELNVDGLDIEDKTKTIIITNKIVMRGIGCAVGGLVAGIVAGIAVATGIPAIVIGCAATFGGGLAGSKIGEGMASTSTKEITVGDNLQEVEDQALQVAEQAVKSLMEKVLQRFEEKFVVPVAEVVGGMLRDMETTIEKLNQELKR